MTTSASPSHTSVVEHVLYDTPSAAKNNVNAQGITKYGYNNTSHNAEDPARAEHINTALSAIDNTVIFLQEDTRKTCSPAPHQQALYRDELLFLSSPASPLPTIDLDTDKFFEDADACIYSPTPPALYVSTAQHAQQDNFTQQEDEGIELGISYADTVHLNFDDIFQQLDAYDLQAQEGYVSEDRKGEVEQAQGSLLGYWAGDYQRHEWVAVKFERERYVADQPSPTTTVHSQL
ncbi:hypothetical protein MBM_04534 [Drepanopeziza brunnea f. sp. 'multigermtubi' MB_m1]|uniref:Uncharacterized protein n=1 Tax=Marssonina brunnea f. sp. multigermtubi (strain MB_m1) TaxID=1072389 RepID=K1WWP8_MARBU|nr:uncharacterized protein MBM_04534 [Drepanopeziza brunnea f. sp. 'multigermtubi' MB_m1]EKD16957.1 hypothetical protein MBM_04534 [Drepanopeziza brunnea f. sp. 'multigermtubi' MB_m1]